MPAVTCGNVTCSAPGVVVPLSGACTSTDGVRLVYLVNGTPADSLTCPAVNATVTVTVQPGYPTLPACPYNATTGFNVTTPRESDSPPALSVQGRDGSRQGRAVCQPLVFFCDAPWMLDPLPDSHLAVLPTLQPLAT
jgi:hypothetical protein